MTVWAEDAPMQATCLLQAWAASSFGICDTQSLGRYPPQGAGLHAHCLWKHPLETPEVNFTDLLGISQAKQTDHKMNCYSLPIQSPGEVDKEERNINMLANMGTEAGKMERLGDVC